jgi:dTDP-4-amino-4,6-dideoxygalactose transaminase
MSEIVAATLDLKLARLPEWNWNRHQVATMYRDRLAGTSKVKTLRVPSWAESANHLFPVEVADRDRVRERLAVEGVETGLHYPVPIHLQHAYANSDHVSGRLPIAERKAGMLMSLPMYPGLTEEDVDFVVDRLLTAVSRAVT